MRHLAWSLAIAFIFVAALGAAESQSTGKLSGAQTKNPTAWPYPDAYDFVTAAGEITAVQSSNGPTLEISEVISALKQARVISPGLRENIPVPTANLMFLPVPMK